MRDVLNKEGVVENDNLGGKVLSTVRACSWSRRRHIHAWYPWQRRSWRWIRHCLRGWRVGKSSRVSWASCSGRRRSCHSWIWGRQVRKHHVERCLGEIYRGSGSNGDVEKYTGASHFVSLAAIRSFLVVSSSVTGKFKDFSSKVLHDSGEIYRGRDLFVFFDSWSPVWRQ